MENLLWFFLVGLTIARQEQLSETTTAMEVVTETLRNRTRSLCGTPEFENERTLIMGASVCKYPHEVFVRIPAPASHVEVNPGAVWVKHCVGLCGRRKTCQPKPGANRTRAIPVRYADVISGVETCAYYYVEEHLECGCVKNT